MPESRFDIPADYTPELVLPELTKEELFAVVRNGCNTSAPGIDGCNYHFFKEVWPSLGDTLHLLYSKVMKIGHHPTRWKRAVAVVIPKPGKDDYSQAKLYRPISLLLCVSKVLERIQCNRLTWLLESIDFFHPTMFGGRTKHSVNEAIFSLLHVVDLERAKKKKASSLFLDRGGASTM